MSPEMAVEHIRSLGGDMWVNPRNGKLGFRIDKQYERFVRLIEPHKELIVRYLINLDCRDRNPLRDWHLPYQSRSSRSLAAQAVWEGIQLIEKQRY
jgi:hypothetical protein